MKTTVFLIILAGLILAGCSPGTPTVANLDSLSLDDVSNPESKEPIGSDPTGNDSADSDQSSPDESSDSNEEPTPVPAPSVSLAPPLPSQATHQSKTLTIRATIEPADLGALVAADIEINTLSGSVSGCTLSGIDTIQSNHLYDISFDSCMGDGSIELVVLAGAIEDGSGRQSEIVKSDLITVDNTPPTVTVSPQSLDPVNVDGEVVFDINYSGAANYTLSAIDTNLITGGTVSGCSTSFQNESTGGHFTVTVDGCSGNGSISLEVSADTASDAAGNLGPVVNQASASVMVDNAPPEITYGGFSTAPVNSSSSTTVRATIAGATSGQVLEVADIDLQENGGVSGCTVAGVTEITESQVYDITVSGCAGNGSFQVIIPEGTFSDPVGNEHADKSTGIAPVDNTGPAVTWSGGVTGSPANSSGTLIFQANYDVTVHAASFVAGDVVLVSSGVAGCSVSNVNHQLGSRYSHISVTGCTGDGSLQVSLPADAVQDILGNGSAASANSTAGTVDNTAPTIGVSAMSPTDGYDETEFTFTLTANEDVTFNIADSDPVPIDMTAGTISGCAVSDVMINSTTEASVTFTGCLQAGVGVVQIPVAAVTDAAGNDNALFTDDESLGINSVAPTYTVSYPSKSWMHNNSNSMFKVSVSGGTADIDSSNVTVNGDNTDCSVAVLGSGTSQFVKVEGCTVAYDDITLTIPRSDITNDKGKPAASDETTDPVSVINTGSDRGFVQISSGINHSCGVRADGHVACWGKRSYGRLGNLGSTSGSENTPTLIDRLNMGPSEKAIKVGVGLDHSCLLTDAGKVYCWGRDNYGQLGDSLSDSSSALPVEAATTGIGAVSDIAVGTKSTCVVIGDQVYCWGHNSKRVVKNEPVTSFFTPQLRHTGVQEMVEIKSGGDNYCVRQMSGQVQCWGQNNVGQLGIGMTSTQETSLSAVSGHSFKSFDMSLQHTCGINLDNDLYCWGDDNDGQLGTGTNSASNAPVAVDNTLLAGGHYRHIDVGHDVSCAIRSTGSVDCWGDDTDGRLGNGATILDVNTPSPIDTTNMGAGTPVHVVIGQGTAFLMTDDDGLYCWGDNGGTNCGGQGSIVTVEVPVPALVPEVSIGELLNEGSTDLVDGSIIANTTGFRAVRLDPVHAVSDGTGQYYFEVVIDDASHSADRMRIGLQDSTLSNVSSDHQIGSTASSCGLVLSSGGKMNLGGSTNGSGFPGVGNGDVVSVLVDTDSSPKTMTFAVNGGATNQYDCNLAHASFVPVFSVGYTSQQMTPRFEIFSHPPTPPWAMFQ